MKASEQKYIEWLAKNDPFLLAVSIKRLTGKSIAPQVVKGELGGFFDSIVDLGKTAVSAVKNVNFSELAKTIGNTAAQLATSKAQVQIINAQTKRAVAGQPPIEVQAYQPALQANFNPATASGQMAINTTAQQLNQNTFDFMRLVPWLALGVGGYFIISKMKR